MNDKEEIFKNEFLEIYAEEGTSPFGSKYSTITVHEIAKLLFEQTQFDGFSWDLAPEGMIAWTIDEDGSANWWNCDDLQTNQRFHDWQVNTRSDVKALRVAAPDFGFDLNNWDLSLRTRNFTNKFKINISVERID